MNKRGLSDIIVTVLIILVALASIVLIWSFVKIFVLSSSEINSYDYTTKLEIPSDKVHPFEDGNLTFAVQRMPGDGPIVGLYIIAEDVSGKTVTREVLGNISEFEVRNIIVDRSWGLSNITKISVAPIYYINGKTKKGQIQATYEVSGSESGNINNGGGCTPDWQCESWSACSGGQQTRTCTDSLCGLSPRTESQSCTVSCTSNCANIGDIQCSGGGYQNCIQSGSCLIWNTTITSCGAGMSCTGNGQCVLDLGNVVNLGVSTEGLIGFWRFEGNLNNAFTNNNNGAVVGSVNCTALGLGDYGRSCAIDGSGTNYINFGDYTTFVRKNLTVIVWIKPAMSYSSTAYWVDILRKEQSYAIQIGGPYTHVGRATWAISGDGNGFGGVFDDITTLSPGVWYMISGTFEREPSGDIGRMYLNGQQKSTYSYYAGNGGVFSGAGALAIGKPTSGNVAFNGSVDNVLVFNRSLSASEMQTLYNNLRLGA